MQSGCKDWAYKAPLPDYFPDMRKGASGYGSPSSTANDPLKDIAKVMEARRVNKARARRKRGKS